MSEGRTEPAANPWPPSRIALWALVACVILLWRGPMMVRVMRPPEGFIVDFFQEWSSARMHRDGLSIYGDQGEAIDRYLGLQVPAKYRERALNRVNAHPPTSVLLVLPLSYLDYRNACLAWNVLSLFALAGSLWIVYRQLELRLSPWAVFPLLCLLLLCGPLIDQLGYGQLNLALLVLIVGAWASARSGRDGLAGLLLGAAICIKLFPAFLGLYFLVRGHWRVLFATAGTVLLLTGLTAAVLGADCYRDYFFRVVPEVTRLNTDSMLNQSLRGFWFRLFSSEGGRTNPLLDAPLAARGLAYLSVAALTATVGWLSYRARGQVGEDHAFGAALLGALLASPISWPHACLLLLLPLVLLWRDLPATGVSRWLFRGCLVVLWILPPLLWRLLLRVNLEDWFSRVMQPWESLTVLSLHTYVLLTVFALLVRASRAATSAAEK